MSDGYQALRLLLRAQESCTVGPVFLWGHHLVCGSSWPSAQPAHGALAPPLAVGGRTESVSRGHVGDTAAGVLSTCFTEPLPGPLRPPQGCLPHAGLAERHCLGVTVPLPAPGPVPVQRPTTLSVSRCWGAVGHPGLSSHGAVSWQRGDQQDCPCHAAVVTSCVSICRSWCCSRLCGVKW